MPLVVCAEPGCPEPAVYRGRCRAHGRERERAWSPNKAVYGTKRWRMLRRAKLGRSPVCERCGVRLATDVHHRVDLRDGGDPWDVEGLEALCRACHSRETRLRQTTV